MAMMLRRQYAPIGIDPEDDPNAIPIGPDPSQIPARQTAMLAPDAMGAKTPITASPVATTPKTPIGNPKLESDQAELSRLQKSGSGIDQLTHPVDAEGNPDASKHPGFFKKLGAVAARVGDIAGTAFFPSITAQIPGTQLHHDVLVNQAKGNVANDIETEQDIAKLNPAPKEPTSEVELFHSQNPNGSVEDFEKAKNGPKLQMALKQHGFKMDDQGNIITDPESPITKREGAKNDYLKAQTDVAKANKELREAQIEAQNAKNDPNSPQFQMAQQKLKVAEMNAQSMGLRGRAAWANYLMHSQSVDESGNVLPGAMLDDNGNAIGSTYSQNVRPTGQERGKADMARSAKDQIADMKEIVSRRPDVFGPAAGRTTDFSVWVGSQDPDAQRFRAARTIAGDHLAGTFGGRSEAALTAIDDAIGHFKDNPKAIAAGLDQLGKANDAFIKSGTVATKGGSHDNSAGGSFKPPSDAPAAPKEDGHQLKSGGKVIAVSKGGKWVKP